MRLYEYEGKELFRTLGIPTPRGLVAGTVEEAAAAAETIGYPVIIKAQVQMGGRGKAGLVKKAENEAALRNLAAEIKDRIRADEKLLIEEAVTAVSEGYLGITIDDVKGVPVLVASAQGGMDVEKVAAGNPNAMAKTYIDVTRGLRKYEILDTLKRAGYSDGPLKNLADVTMELYRLFKTYEADTAEINPILFLEDGRLVAGDSKVIVDDYAVFRNEILRKIKDQRKDPESNTKAIYVPLNGNIGIVSLGASNTMMLIDSIKCFGGEPANFADLASGVDHDSMEELATVILKASENKAKVVLINITLAGASLKVVMEGVLDAIKKVQPKMPLVANVRATGAARLQMSTEEAVAALEQAGVICCSRLEDAISMVIRISKE